METASDQIYQKLCSGILGGDYPAGSFLREAPLADDLQCSSVTMLETLRRMSREGWVEELPYRGFRVLEWGSDDVEEVFELRALLEAHAARRCARHMDAEQSARLSAIIAEAEALLDSSGEVYARFSELNVEFHSIIMAGAQSYRLMRLIDDVMCGAISARSTHRLSNEQLHEVLDHHRKLAEALQKGDGDRASILMQAHIMAVFHGQP